MKRIAGLLVTVAMISGCAGIQKQPAEGLSFFIPKDYKYKFSKEFTVVPRQMYLTRLVFDGESIDNWTEALEWINTWRKNYPPSIDEVYNNAVDKRKKQCPESEFAVISKDNTSVLYEVKTVNCPPNPDENSLTRVLYGNSDVFVLIYTNKVKELPPEKRNVWIDVLSEAKIEVEN